MPAITTKSPRDKRRRAHDSFTVATALLIEAPRSTVHDRAPSDRDARVAPLRGTRRPACASRCRCASRRRCRPSFSRRSAWLPALLGFPRDRIADREPLAVAQRTQCTTRSAARSITLRLRRPLLTAITPAPRPSHHPRRRAHGWPHRYLTAFAHRPPSRLPRRRRLPHQAGPSGGFFPCPVGYAWFCRTQKDDN